MAQVVRYVQGLVVKAAGRYHRQDLFDDLVQAGNVGVLRAIASFQPKKGANFTTWVNYWVRAVQMVLLRGEGRYVETHVSLEEPISEDEELVRGDVIAADGPTPEDSALAVERQELVVTAANLGPTKQRQVMRSILAGRTLEETGRLNGFTRENARQHKLKAFARMRIVLEDIS